VKPVAAGLVCITLVACRRDSDLVTPPTDGGVDVPPEAMTPEAMADSVPEASDARSWTGIPGWADCEIFALSKGLETIPARTWSSCGAGCLASPAATVGWSKGWAPIATATFRDGDVLLKTGSIEPTFATQLSRLSDGRTLGFIEQRRPMTECGALAAHNLDSADLVTFFSGKSATIGAVRLVGGTFVSSALRDATGKIAGSQVAVGVDGWGIGTRNGLYLAPEASTTSWTRLDTAEPVGVSGRGGAIVWSSFAGADATLFASFDATTPTALLKTSPEGAPIFPVLATERLAWVSVMGPERAGGIYTGARLSWSDGPLKKGVPVNALSAPPIPFGFVGDPQLGPDHIALVACAKGSDLCPIVVTQISSKKQWLVPARASMRWRRVLTVTSKEIVAVDASEDAPSYRADAIVRLDLGAIDALSAADGGT